MVDEIDQHDGIVDHDAREGLPDPGRVRVAETPERKGIPGEIISTVGGD